MKKIFKCSETQVERNHWSLAHIMKLLRLTWQETGLHEEMMSALQEISPWAFSLNSIKMIIHLHPAWSLHDYRQTIRQLITRFHFFWSNKIELFRVQDAIVFGTAGGAINFFVIKSLYLVVLLNYNFLFATVRLIKVRVYLMEQTNNRVLAHK